MVERVRRRLGSVAALISASLLASSALGQDVILIPQVFPWRGVLIGADHTSPGVHHDNIYVTISESPLLNGGPTLYYTTIPARQEGSEIADPGLLLHIFTRDNTTYALQAASSFVDGAESALSEGLAVGSDDTGYSSCSEQTVPVAEAGEDQLVAVGTAVTLDATGSHDPHAPDTAQLSFRWELYSAPTDVAFVPDATAAVTSFTPTAVGDYYFRLFVADKTDLRFNRSPVAYVRISAVADLNAPGLLYANAGRPQQVEVGQGVTLDGSRSAGPGGTTYQWEQTNPLGARDLQSLAQTFGTTNCNETCYRTNFDANSVVDGRDLALLASSWGPVDITNADQPVAEFHANIARPHIFRLTLSDGSASTEETAIVAVHHPSVAEVLAPPPFDTFCSP